MLTETAIKLPIPNPGLYPNMDAETYFAWEAASNSRATDMMRSARYARRRIDFPSPPTASMILGTATHLITLQPSLWDMTYVVSCRCQATKRDGGRCSYKGKWLVAGEWLCGDHVKANRHEHVFKAEYVRLLDAKFRVRFKSESGSIYFTHEDGGQVRLSDHAPNTKTLRWMKSANVWNMQVNLPPLGSDDPRQVLTPDQWDACRRMRDSIMAHPIAAALLAEPGQTELAGVFTDRITDQLCKFRIDKTCESSRIILDIKSTANARLDEFARSIGNYGYHRQAAMYLDGSAANRQMFDDFIICAVESDEDSDYDCAVYRIDEDDIERGRAELTELLSFYKKCDESGEWPGYSRDIQDIKIPHYFR